MALSLGVGRSLGWGAVNALGASRGIVLWDTRVLQLLEMEEGTFTISCLFKNVEDGVQWSFTGVYGPCLGSSKESLWEELDRGVLEGVSMSYGFHMNVVGKEGCPKR